MTTLTADILQADVVINKLGNGAPSATYGMNLQAALVVTGTTNVIQNRILGSAAQAVSIQSIETSAGLVVNSTSAAGLVTLGSTGSILQHVINGSLSLVKSTGSGVVGGNVDVKFQSVNRNWTLTNREDTSNEFQLVNNAATIPLKITTANAFRLTGTLALGNSNTGISWIEEGSFTTTFTWNGTSGGTTGTATIALTRVGSMVTALVTGTAVATSGSSTNDRFTANSAIPANFRPSATVDSSPFGLFPNSTTDSQTSNVARIASNGTFVCKAITGIAIVSTNQANSGFVINQTFVYSVA